MPPKKRKSAVIAAAEEHQPSSSNEYKKKLRSSRQEPSSSNTVVAATDKHQPPAAKVAKKRLSRQKHEPVKDENEIYTFKSPRPQRFSLPENIVYYMVRNPINCPCHQNVIQTCKLLFRMSRIIPVERAEAKFSGNMVMMAKNQLNQDREKCIFLRKEYSKIWIYDKLIILNHPSSKFVSMWAQRIHKLSLKELTLYNQVISFDELQFLAGGGELKKVVFVGNVVKNADGNITEFEKVFEVLYCKNMIVRLPRDAHGVGKDTASKMVEIWESNGREYSFVFFDIPQALDITVLSDFLKANMNNDRQHTNYLSFADTISAEYKEQLQKLVDELILIRGIYAHTVPMISFRGQNIDSYVHLRDMRDKPVEGIHKKPGISCYIYHVRTMQTHRRGRH